MTIRQVNFPEGNQVEQRTQNQTQPGVGSNDDRLLRMDLFFESQLGNHRRKNQPKKRCHPTRNFVSNMLNRLSLFGCQQQKTHP